MFDAALPFTFVENEKFRKFLSFICPGYTPTTRVAIAGPFLDVAFKETSMRVNLHVLLLLLLFLSLLLYLTLSRLVQS